MVSVKAIACVDNNFGIGYKGNLLFRIPEDMQFFKSKTIGHSVIMGRKTFESIGSPLKGRENIIITSSIKSNSNNLINGEKIIFCSASFADGYIIESTKFKCNKTFYVIGGESIYNRYFNIYDEIFLTQVDTIRKADKHFPNLEILNRYKKIDTIKSDYTKDGICYNITRWIPKK